MYTVSEMTQDPAPSSEIPPAVVAPASRPAGDPDAVASARAWLAGWSDEVAAVDLAAGRRRFGPDVSAFGTHANVLHGLDTLFAEQWSKVWPTIEDFRFLADEAEVIVSPDSLQAVVVALWDSTGIAADGTRFPRPGRATVVLVRDEPGAPWRGVHTHFSLSRGVPQQSFGQRPART